MTTVKPLSEAQMKRAKLRFPRQTGRYVAKKLKGDWTYKTLIELLDAEIPPDKMDWCHD